MLSTKIMEGAVMKYVLILLQFLALLACLNAIVMIPRFMARFWVDETDACFVMFGDEAWGEKNEVKDFFITLCEGESVLAGSRITDHI